MTHNGSVLPGAAYVHIPFCVSKCSYCDFNSYPGMESLFGDYIEALIAEIRRAGRGAPRVPLDSVYFGGGTPTVLDPKHLAAVLDAIRATLGLSDGCEVTVEANPGTVSQPSFVQLYASGFNRVSLGVQSLDDVLLKKIGRVHDARQAAEAYHQARAAGFANVGVDLIFALPGQDTGHWRRTLDAALQLAPEHISLYELSVEEGTRFADLCAQGRLDLPDEDSRADMYELTIETLTGAGYEHYEVSNFALPGFRSRHNQVYWRNEPYYGFGAGATSYLDGERVRRIGDPAGYIASVMSGAGAVEYSERLSDRARLAETIVQGLRMLEGVDLRKLTDASGLDAAAEFSSEIEGLVRRGLLEAAGGRLRVTHQGLLLMNDVAVELVSEE